MIFATKNDQISIYQDIKIVSSNDILEDVIFGSFQDIFLVCPINAFRDNVCYSGQLEDFSPRNGGYFLKPS